MRLTTRVVVIGIAGPRQYFSTGKKKTRQEPGQITVISLMRR
ncbi:hypothetical protein [Pseudomonas sp. UW4]|nr:hypothetical protein [Pseudomonas sp. UW4]